MQSMQPMQMTSQFPWLLAMAVPGVLLLGGMVLLWFGWRGRRVDDHPVCRRCGYDLHHAADDTTSCPECGGELSGSRAIRRGNRVRRRGLLTAAAVCLLLGGGGLGATGYGLTTRAGTNWIHYKPFTWTLRAAASQSQTHPEANVAELHRRLQSGELDPGQVQQLAAASLKAHADPAAAWVYGHGWRAVLDELIRGGDLSQSEFETLMDQVLAVEFEMKPTIRKGRSLRYSLQGNPWRMPDFTPPISSSRRSGPMRVGGVELQPAGEFDRDLQPGNFLGGGYSVTTGLPRSFDAVPLGPAELTLTLDHRIEPPAGSPWQPIDLQRQVTLPVTVYGHDDIVDNFEADPAHAAAMDQSWTQTRVETGDGGSSIWLRFDPPPVSLAMEVWLHQGGESWRHRSLRVQGLAAPRWHQLESTRAKVPEPGPIDVELRPDQAPADTADALDTYWGDPLRREGIVVDAPYTPAFNRDAAVAPAVEAAVTLRDVSMRMTDKGPRLSLAVRAQGSPVRLAYLLEWDAGDGWVRPPRGGIDFQAGVGDNTGYSTSHLELPEPVPATLRFRLVPDPDWEAGRTDLTPPWAYPLEFEAVTLPDADAGEPPIDKLHGKADLGGAAGP